MDDDVKGWAMLISMAERIERGAVQGARNDPRTDQSDWIRLWAAARQAQGKPSGATDWRAAVGPPKPVDYDWTPDELAERHGEG